MKPTIKVVLDTRNKNQKSSIFPVKLRVTFLRSQKYYPLDIKMTESDFSKCFDKNAKGDLLKKRMQIVTEEAKAAEIISRLNVFTFEAFHRKFNMNQLSTDSVYNFYENVISEKKQAGELGTASNYECSLHSLRKFSTSLKFMDVTKEFLTQYQNHLIKQGKSISTVGIYLRPLRAIMNLAISDGLITKEYNYPFGKNKYQIPTSRNTKKALTLSEIEQIFFFIAEKGGWEEKARDFWIFSYLANGMNVKDISLLTTKNIDGEYLRFTRAKTKLTNKIQDTITVYITKEMRQIIEKWRNAPADNPYYLFPILTPGASNEMHRREIQQFIKMMNRYMNRIALKLNIDKPITTYYARHSFSTVLKRSGADIEYIREALGHSNSNTTRSYLDSFEDETKKVMANALTNFKREKLS